MKNGMARLIRVCGLVLLFAILSGITTAFGADAAEHSGKVAVIGTGFMGGALGPRFAELGYTVTYGSRDPERESVRQLVARTGHGASARKQQDAVADAELVVLAVGWPAMEQVAQNLGNLDGKIIVDVSDPMKQGPDGYQVRLVETSSAEMIQEWNPGAIVVKAFNTLGYFLIADPSAIDEPITVPIAADDRAAKEKVARIVADMGLDPVDSGPLRFAHELEGMAMIYMMALDQRRPENWEFSFRRTTHWSDIWEDDWSVPVQDAEDLAEIPGLDNLNERRQ